VSEEAILSAENSEKSLGGQGSAPDSAGSSQRSPNQMWSETVSLRTRPVWDLRSWSWSFCVVKYNRVTLVVIMISEDTAAFQVLV